MADEKKPIEWNELVDDIKKFLEGLTEAEKAAFLKSLQPKKEKPVKRDKLSLNLRF